MTDIKGLFYNILQEVEQNYDSYNFMVERDVVWTIQKMIARSLKENGLPYKIFNDYPIEKGIRRSNSVDLAIIREKLNYKDVLEGKEKIDLAIEFKFEPSKNRKDICVHKLPVVFWNKIEADIERVKRFVEDGKAKVAIAIFIDEYGRYNREGYKFNKPTKWINWGNYGTNELNVSTLITEVL